MKTSPFSCNLAASMVEWIYKVGKAPAEEMLDAKLY